MKVRKIKASSTFALIAKSERAMKISAVLTGASTSCIRSRPAKKTAMTVGNPTTSMSTDRAVNAPARIASRAEGMNWAAASATPKREPPKTSAANDPKMPSSTTRARLPVRIRLRHARSSARRITAIAEPFMKWVRAGAR